MAANADRIQDQPMGCEIAAADWEGQRFGWLEGVRHDSALNATAKLVAHILALDFANRKTARCDPSFRQIAEVTNSSEDTVKRAVAALVEEGWIAHRSGRGAGRRSSFCFLTRAQIVPLHPSEKSVSREKKSANLPPKKSANLPPKSNGKKGANLREKGGKFAPAYYKDKPCNNHGAHDRAIGSENEHAERRASDIAEFWADKIASGRFAPAAHISRDTVQEILDRGMLTRDQLRAAGIDC